MRKVIYRRGGTENWSWHETSSFHTLSTAKQCLEEVRKMGYHAWITDAKEPLPTNYEGTT